MQLGCTKALRRPAGLGAVNAELARHTGAGPPPFGMDGPVGARAPLRRPGSTAEVRRVVGCRRHDQLAETEVADDEFDAWPAASEPVEAAGPSLPPTPVPARRGRSVRRELGCVVGVPAGRWADGVTR